MIYALLIIIVGELAGLIYLNFKKLPTETQKEVLRKVEPVKTEVVDWMPPKEEDELAEEEVRKTMI